MSKLLSPGEVSVGQKVTVLSWKPREHINLGGFGDTAVSVSQDRSYCGDVLEVTAVDLPFVVVKMLKGLYNSGRPITLNTSELTLMELSDAFVTAAMEGQS